MYSQTELHKHNSVRVNAQPHCSHSHASVSSATMLSLNPLVSCSAHHFLMQSISKPHNQHSPNGTLGVMHYSTNQHMLQRRVRQPTHYLPRKWQELTKIPNECGVPTTCNESRLPYRDEGTQNCSRKRADMMTLCNCGITPNQILNFRRTTHLVMELR